MAKEGKTKRKYFAKDGSRLKRGKVQAYGEELHRIARENDGVTAEIVLEKAKSKKSPLHDHFEWSDTKAAAKYRLDQARSMIRWITVEIVYTGSNKALTIKPVIIERAFRHVTNEDGEGAYQTLAEIQENEDHRSQVEQQLASELEQVAEELQRYQHLADYALQVKGIAKKVRAAKKPKGKKKAKAKRKRRQVA